MIRTFRAVWYSEAGDLIIGSLVDKMTAFGQVETLKKYGRVAWVEDNESRPVDENGDPLPVELIFHKIEPVSKIDFVARSQRLIDAGVVDQNGGLFPYAGYDNHRHRGNPLPAEMVDDDQCFDNGLGL